MILSASAPFARSFFWGVFLGVFWTGERGRSLAQLGFIGIGDRIGKRIFYIRRAYSDMRIFARCDFT
ncbi:MAG: hypothetical protein DBX55_02630 [Verrucomicrobia bacterium]|nr:MAG: hypothetical protein DBX55_02630 [Verrucomicrobiota bacterium]